MTVETFFANFGHLADAPNGVQKLRELILQLAVQGKLVPQDPNDEPASVLLERIDCHKKELLAKKVIRKSATLFPKEEAPAVYPLPLQWEWALLGRISTLLVDGSHNPPPKRPDGIPMLSGQNVENNSINFRASRYITEEDYLIERERNPIQAGDVFLTIVGTIGRSAVVPEQMPKCALQRSIAQLRTGIFPYYLSFYLQSVIAHEYFYSHAKGTAQKGIYLNKVSLLPVPLPPFEEQKRIVAKVDQLMALCNELEARQQKQQQVRVRLNNAALDALLTAREPDEFADHWQRICNNFDLIYDHPETIAKLRAAILQLAVQGKLVPQDPNDEPASVLLERIKAEKERLVKEGKIKKQKPLPEIDESLAPFEIPAGWAWARFPEVGEFGRGKSKHRPRNDPSLYSGGKYPMVQTGDVARANGEVRTYTALYNDAGLAQSRLWPKGTMCITIAANIADSAVLGFDACFPDSVVGLIASQEIGDVRYFEYFIRTAKERLMDFAPSTAQKNINLGILETVYIPLPPLAEMKRIVAKVDQLMSLCDKLEAKLNQAQQHSEKLMEATVRQLLEPSAPPKPQTNGVTLVSDASSPGQQVRHAYQLAPDIAEPLAAEAVVDYGGSVPEAILAVMQSGQAYSRADILAATGIREADWVWAIKQLKEQGRVVQKGERRGARYVKAD
ncbi:type I restriction enzyme S subunit [Geothermobacter ehrlichii]|uniref:Type I restriction enzyme S subunit n=1 Tax=Geothermobacter ehrlichii TaxID=213224 RepID=A0A5D3WN31_9BACT|nr:restriction endonuclease subunit S [Geothermobacter ehrlichii]TYO99977.1 type I restriction enzyme S subunit [Geothermobacter ehrlichii]